MGIMSLGYYVILRCYTGRKDSTFLPFWMGFGLAALAAGAAWPYFPDWFQKGVWIVGGCFCLLFVIVEIRIICAMWQRPPKKMNYVVVLGAQVRGQRISRALKRRLDRAAEYMQDNPETKAILSGGQGKGEAVSEAEAMERYLCEKGVGKGRLILETASTSTWENLENSRKLLPDPSREVGIVTNDFHVYRAVLTAKAAGYKNPKGLSADSAKILLPNYLTREFFACLKFWVQKVHKRRCHRAD